MKNKRGFTLAELIGAIIIIGLLMMVVLTSISGQISSKEEQLTDASKKVIIETVKEYLNDNQEHYKKNDNSEYYISLGQLIEKGYLEDSMINQKNILNSNKKAYIKITSQRNSFKYEFYNDNSLLTVGDIMDSLLTTNTFSFMDGKYKKQDYSYLKFNGTTWMMLGKNKDESIKLMMTEPVTAIIPNNGFGYEKSYVRKWLNNIYYNSLTEKDLIKKEDFCKQPTIGDFLGTVNCTDVINDYIGLPSIYEVYFSNNFNKFSNYRYSTMQTKSDSLSHTIYVTSYDASYNDYGIMTNIADDRNLQNIIPVINIYEDSLITSGSGTILDPYTVNSKYSQRTSLKNDNIFIGEYVKFKDYSSNLFRINKITDSKVRLIAVDSMTTIPSSKFSGNITNDLIIDINKTLNSNLTWLKNTNAVTKDIYSSNISNSYDYSEGLLEKNLIGNYYASLPTVGDLFISNYQNYPSIKYYTTRVRILSSSNGFSLFKNGFLGDGKQDDYQVFPQVYCDSNEDILSGNGTKENPYIIN